MGVVGFANKISDNAKIGAFIELGGGDYDSFNDFAISGEGKIKYAGVGAISQLNFGDAYVKTSAKIGRVKSDYKSVFMGAKELEYDISRTYWGLGAGFWQ